MKVLPSAMTDARAQLSFAGRSGGALEREWRSLRYFNLYRIILSAILITLGTSGIVPRPDLPGNPSAFVTISVIYAALGVLFSFWMRAQPHHFDTHVVAQVFVDIIAVTTLLHVSGGVTSGLSLLLVVAVAGGSILSRGRLAMLYAAMAAIAVLAQQLVAWNTLPVQAVNYTYEATLGIVFFATAWLANLSANRIRASEALVAERDVDLRNLAELNETIIQRMQSGILVADVRGNIVLSNGSTRALLGVDLEGEPRALTEIEPELNQCFECWQEDSYRSTYSFQCASTQLDLTASFAALGVQGTSGVLIFLEDASPMTQRAQQLKLASLGRLTASIAHEIRNPLGAISHAGQLLDESESLDSADRRLSQIIQDNCRRMNGIIEDVLQLSRRTPAIRQELVLRQWLEAFVNELRGGATSNLGFVTFSVQNEALVAPFDSDQLRQVVSNLVENGLRHSGDSGLVTLSAGVTQESQRPFLDVLDEGDGIADSDRDQVFEPFFTTRADGTGLGLYIARELCEINQASLRLLPSERGCLFRITFADPRR
jgi:two-component system sensor histidine kinase PilS (NtrC family)